MEPTYTAPTLSIRLIADSEEQIVNLQWRLDDLHTQQAQSRDYMADTERDPGFRRWRQWRAHKDCAEG